MTCLDCDPVAPHGVNRPGDEFGGSARRAIRAVTGRAATLATSTLRTLYAPACTGRGAMFLDAYRALDACFRAHGYRVRKDDTGAYNCRRITGGTGYSLHAYGPADRFTFWTGVTIATALAVDINWQTNPYGRRLVTDMPPAMIAAIKAIRTRSGRQVWRWGGDYSGNKDAMHFEIVCSPQDLATGIDPATVPGHTPPPVQEDDDMTDDDRALLRAMDLRLQALDQRTARIEKALGDAKGLFLPRLIAWATRVEAKLR